MIVGIDLDNTIINYSKIFKNIANKRLKIKGIKSKEEIKKTLFRTKDIKTWQKIQSEVYGDNLFLAKPYQGFIYKLRELLKKNEIRIISHKTKKTYYNQKIDLHDITKNWINIKILSKLNKDEKNKIKIFLETTKKKKIKKIIEEKCDFFIDDLEEILNLLPNKITKYLFNTNEYITSDDFMIINSWKELKIEN